MKIKEKGIRSQRSKPRQIQPLKLKNQKRKESGPSKIDFYLNHLKKEIPKLHALGIRHVAIRRFSLQRINMLMVSVENGLHVVSELRIDPLFSTTFTLASIIAWSKKKNIETGKANFEYFKDSVVTEIYDENDEKIELRSCIVYSISLNRLNQSCFRKKKYEPWINMQKPFCFQLILNWIL